MSDSAVTMVVTEPRGPLRPSVAEPASPPAGWVRVSVAASGVCNADIGTAAATGKRTAFPVTPGHEVAGVIAEIGDQVEGWAVGDRVAVGWFGGSCGHCSLCRTGDVVHCAERKVPGLSYAGGWAQSLTAPADALARIPDGLGFFDAAPFGCAGVTTFNTIRKAGIRAGGRVAVFGIGGLGTSPSSSRRNSATRPSPSPEAATASRSPTSSAPTTTSTATSRRPAPRSRRSAAPTSSSTPPPPRPPSTSCSPAWACTGSSPLSASTQDP
ncbi:Alcohol dehydrogenase [Streptomyces sp. V17-9]|nr:Alcohol dehydrogenase [Streptomyces sp. V17-9]